jgi:hypothetical protein
MKPKRFGVEDVTKEEVTKWQAELGDLWADTVCPELLTRVWDFDTEAEARAFLAGPIPSGYCASLFERTNLRRGPEGLGWDWDTKELPLRLCDEI